MARVLDVYLHEMLAGKLIQDDGGQMQFRYTEDWLGSAKAVPLSYSLPLREGEFSHRACAGFFNGILPEEAGRELIAKNLGISARNDFSMLAEIGRECAGAVIFMPEGEPLPEKEYHYRPLDEAGLAQILRELPTRPLLAGGGEVRLSLAGAQSKIAVAVTEEGIALPLGGAPSTHILKPAVERFEGIVYNEAFCMKLAAAVDLPVAEVGFGRAEDVEYLLVERYDRKHRPDGRILRLHQEDFCQALGTRSEQKYQAEGGPSLKDCFALLRQASAAPVVDLRLLLDAVIFNVLIGNHDAHGKNFSLLYDRYGGRLAAALLPPKKAMLAPFYDLIATAVYPELSSKMAMKIGGEYQSELLLDRHFAKLAEDAGLSANMTVARRKELAETVLSALDNIDMTHPAADAVRELVRKRCEAV